MSVSQPGSQGLPPLMFAGASNKGPTSLRSSPTPEPSAETYNSNETPIPKRGATNMWYNVSMYAKIC